MFIKLFKRLTALLLCLSLLLSASLYCVATDYVMIEDYVNIRSYPQITSGNIVGMTPDYTKAELIEEAWQGDGYLWYHVVTDYGTEGWVRSDLAEKLPPESDDSGDIVIVDTTNYVMINDGGVNIRTGPGTDYPSIGEVWSCRLPFKGKSGNWYNITSPGGHDVYIYGDFVDEYSYTYDAAFEQTLLQFPTNYRDGLRYLHTQYPDWVFHADNLSITLDYAVSEELGRKIISNGWTSLPESWRADISGVAPLESGNRYASDVALKFAMDPANYITRTSIFMFLMQSYDASDQTVDGVKKLIKGSYIDSDEYAGYIMEAAAVSGVSPYVLASTILHEQGKSGSELSFGRYPGYEGYYNFFNFSASGITASDIIRNGLQYAKDCGWDSPRNAIIGGAKQYGSAYVTSGQYNYYYKDYNVLTQTWWHQYATGIFDHINSALTISEVYKSINGPLTFRIPVYAGSSFGEHTHSYGNLVSNETHHWRECSGCGGTTQYEQHTFGEPETVPAGLFTYGYTKRTCTVCKCEITDPIPPIISYYDAGDGIEIEGFTAPLPEVVVIPEEIDGKKVTAIRSYALFASDTLRELIISSDETGLGDNAVNGNVTVICNSGSNAAKSAVEKGIKLWVIGGVCGNATVTRADAQLLAKYILGLTDNCITDMRIADLNKDGVLNVSDCVLISLLANK